MKAKKFEQQFDEGVDLATASSPPFQRTRAGAAPLSDALDLTETACPVSQ